MSSGEAVHMNPKISRVVDLSDLNCEHLNDIPEYRMIKREMGKCMYDSPEDHKLHWQ